MSGNDGGRREVVVPLRLYKTITVFSTLLAVLFVVVGFTFLDAATVGGGFIAALLDLLPFAVPTLVDRGTASLLLALAGLALVGLGAGTYVLGSRFRAEGMGKDKERED